MRCPECGGDTSASGGVCTRCGTFLAAAVVTPASASEMDLALTGLGVSPVDDLTRSGPPSNPSTRGGAAGPKVNYGPLEPGTAFGGRYHVIRLLGMGGMGAVYQAWDDELAEAVAIKVIRPEITEDPAAARDIERRFKRELVTARQVTHRNVVRIHDLGEIDGIKYITMPYINGSDLATILKREGRLSVRRALSTARQLVAGLKAAHDAGVVHRDLKPANIMIDPDDNAVIMDFGIARSVSGGDATVVGAVVGTLEYMAPEQAMAQPVDHRADIYSFGLILYDMLTGRRDSSRAESAIAELMKRIAHPLPPIRTRDASIPEALEEIITRCLAPDPAGRFQTPAALEAAFASLDADGQPSGGAATGTQPLTRPFTLPPPTVVAAPAPGRRSLPWAWIAGGLAALAAIVTALVMSFGTGGTPRTSESASDKPLALAILPFRNATGTASLDGLGPTLAEMIRAEVGQSARLRLVASERIAQTLRDLRIGPDADLDVGNIRKLADFNSATTVVTGRFVKLGEQIRIEASVHDAQRDPVVLTASAAGESDLMNAAQQLGRSIRESLALTRAAVKELEANPFKPSSQSIQALRMYSEGLEYARQGEHIQAVKRFEEATKADAAFALAFSRLGQAFATLGRESEAETASRQAVSLSQALPAEEKDLIAATHATIIRDSDKAIEAYQRLVRVRPADAQLHFELARLHESKGAFDQARDEYAKVLETDAKSVDALLAAGRVEIQRGAFQDSLGFLNKAQTLAVQLENRQAKANVLQALGIAYKNLGNLDDALRHYKESLAIKREIKDQRGAAASLGEIAHIHDRQGRPDEAVDSYKEALEIRRAIGDTAGVGLTLINLGASHINRAKHDEALTALTEALQIWRERGDDSQLARCLSNIGYIYLATGKYEDARSNLERALELREKLKNSGNIALTLTSLADVSTRLGDYGPAEKHYLRAIELWRGAGNKRGTAEGTFGMANLFEAQGRYGATLEARGEALKTLRDLGERSTLLAEVLAGFGYAQALTMKTADARKTLDEALAVAEELKSQTLVAQTLNYQGDNAYFAADLKGARALYERAQAAARSADRYQLLRARVNLAKVAAEEGRATAAVELRSLAKEADDLGLKYLAAESSLHLGAALLKANHLPQAKAALESAMTRIERIGARALQANASYLLGEAVRRSDKAGNVTTHYRQALQVLDEMQKEARNDTLSTRFDLRQVREQSTHWLDPTKK